MKRFLSILFASAAIGLAAVPAEATLTTIGTATYNASDYNLIYDNDIGLIWLDYTNAADLRWNQLNWAAGLNGAGVLTYNINPGLTVTWGGNWRLPETNPATPNYVFGYDGTTSAGYNITTSEMGHLYYTELGNKGYYATDGSFPQPGWGLNNQSPFTNLHPYGGYSSSTDYATPWDVWYFSFYDGYQGIYDAGGDFYALAVRPGDVAAVPEPGTMMLMGSGLVGLIATRRLLGRRHG